jgi:caffeoyl-CoA O-methyltransferase
MTADFQSLFEEFILRNTTPEEPVLAELNRLTYQKVLNPRMLSGHLQGRLLTFFSQMIQPEKILEIGTFTGYSAICLAKGLKPGGILHTIEINDELKDISLSYFKKAGVENKIMLHNGNAIEIISNLSDSFDLVFIDGEKSEYPVYLELVLPKLKNGGFIMADNVFWNGKVLNPDCLKDPSTAGIMRFCEAVNKNPKLQSTIIPLRDGLMLIRKNE